MSPEVSRKTSGSSSTNLILAAVLVVICAFAYWLEVRKKPATKAREGINPFTKEPTIFKAKPARNVVRVRPLQVLKAMV